MQRNCLVLTQFRNKSKYNDFIGRYYHFPEKYLGNFSCLPAEFVYYEGSRTGEGVFFGYGKIKSLPTLDKREIGHYFVEITDYKPFVKPVFFKDDFGKIKESGFPNYNPQNAVRKISTELLDEICLDGNIRLNFRADAHLIKVLGEQLIASEKIGILELIKNSYDAGASYCRVRIENIPSLPIIDKSEYLFPELPGPVIIIEDDGSGMSREVIENGWLRPASTIKTVLKERIKEERLKAAAEGKLGAYDKLISEIKKERGGRIPLGEKGVGRFASNRLGRRLLLKTKISNLKYEYVLDVDWDMFESGEEISKDLESVGLCLTRCDVSRDYGIKDSGTQLIIYGSREGFSWDQETVLELQRSINSLNSPNPSPKNIQGKGFHAFLQCPQIGELSNNNPTRFFEATFSFNGLMDDEGILDYTLNFNPPKTVVMPPEEIGEKKYDLRKSELDYWTNNGVLRKPECGPFYLHVDVWYRKNPWINTTGPESTQFINDLTVFGGISIFRDGINIFPAEWGAETDWLNLSKRHIKQGFRISYYNIIGNLEVNQLENFDLIDKTNREGLIENRAFKDLTKLIKTIVTTIIETKFIAKRDEYNSLTGEVIRDPKILKEFARQGSRLISDIKDNYPIDKDPYQILTKIGNEGEREGKLVNLSNSLKNLQKSINIIQEAQDLLTEQAGYGMAIAVSVHEIAKIAGNFYAGVSHLLKQKEPDYEKLKDLKDASASLQSELKRLGPLRAVRNEEQTEFGIIKPIRYVVEIFQAKLVKENIKVEVNAKENFNIYGRYGALIQILSNLFDNSCYWLRMVEIPNRKIKIHINPLHRTVTVSDSGPGIDEVILPYLFQAGYSLRIPPSGLGLYICRHYMQSMKGDIYLTNHHEKLNNLNGAQFTIDFNKVPSDRSTGVKR